MNFEAMSTASTSIVLDNTFGALFIGVVIAMGLWGVSSIQMYYYFIQYPKDAWWLKVLVILVWMLGSAHQGLITQACYVYLVSHRGNPTFLHVIVPTLDFTLLSNAVVCLLVQTFLVYRAWRLSDRNLLLAGPLLVFAVAQFITTIILFSTDFHKPYFVEVPSIWLAKISLTVTAAADICIAITLIFLLHRCRTGTEHSEAIINRLILFTINTGALTSIFALLAIIFVSVYPHALIYLAFYVCISGLYVNTFFATLNVRKATRESLEASTDQLTTRILSWRCTESEPRAMDRSYNDRISTTRTETEATHGLDDTVLDDLESGETMVHGSAL